MSRELQAYIIGCIAGMICGASLLFIILGLTEHLK
jgi:hypothetical protein